MPEATETLGAAASSLAAAGLTAAARDLSREAKKDHSVAWRWSTLGVCFLGLLALTYFLIVDARHGHAMTQDEYVSSNKDRDEKVAAVRVDFQAMTIRLAAAIESVATLKTDVKDSESRLRTEIQGTNARIDRVFEAVSKPR